MAGNLTGLHVFANDVSPEPLSLLDTNYSAINVALNALATFSNYYVDSGIANAMAIAVTANQTVAYSDGLLLQIQVAASNTGATTLNVAGIGPKNVVDQAGNALPAGMLLGGSYITVIYRATANNFQLLDGGQFAGGSGIGHNPTALVGLVVVNGVATTFMRSDAAPPIDQTISPTWTGTHLFTNAGNAVGIRGDTSVLFFQNTAIGNVAQLGTIKSWVGSGSVTDFAIGAFGALNFYTGNSTTPAVVISTTRNITLGQQSSGDLLTLNAGTAAGTRALQINGTSGNICAIVTGANSAGNSFGLRVDAGLNSSDYCVQFNQRVGFTIFQLRGDGVILGNGPVAAALLDMTPDKSSWTTTLSGLYASNPSGTLKWERQGTQVTIWCDSAITATSNATAFTISASGLPAAITPSSNRYVPCVGIVCQTGATQGAAGFVSVNSGGTLTIGLIGTAGGANPQPIGTQAVQFANATGTGLAAGWSITYSL